LILVLVSVFSREITTFPGNICWRNCLFSIVSFWGLCQKSGGHSCEDSYPGLLFYAIGFLICFCASTILFFFIWFWSIVFNFILWNQYYTHLKTGYNRKRDLQDSVFNEHRFKNPQQNIGKLNSRSY
jgi:hypothetical protein